MAIMIEGKDKGLYSNATEFFAELARLTHRCVQHPD
jgi:hypothetical protein